MHNKGETHHHHKPSEERSISGEVKVHGGVQVFSTEGAINQHNAEREQDNAYKEHTRTHELRSMVLSRSTLIVTAAYFVVTGLIFLQSKRSADAAKSAANTAQKQLELSERPWISAEVSLRGPIVFNANGAVADLDVRLKNIGNSVAKYTSVWTGLVVQGADSPLDEQRRLCGLPKLPENKNSDYGYLIFPQQVIPGNPNFVAESEYPAIASPEKINKGLHSPGGFGGKAIAFYVVVCVDYLSPLDEVHHQTRLLRSVGYVDPIRNNGIFGDFYPAKGPYDAFLIRQMHGDSAD